MSVIGKSSDSYNCHWEVIISRHWSVIGQESISHWAVIGQSSSVIHWYCLQTIIKESLLCSSCHFVTEMLFSLVSKNQYKICLATQCFIINFCTIFGRQLLWCYACVIRQEGGLNLPVGLPDVRALRHHVTIDMAEAPGGLDSGSPAKQQRYEYRELQRLKF
jgi:hypothetical protein